VRRDGEDDLAADPSGGILSRHQSTGRAIDDHCATREEWQETQGSLIIIFSRSASKQMGKPRLSGSDADDPRTCLTNWRRARARSFIDCLRAARKRQRRSSFFHEARAIFAKESRSRSNEPSEGRAGRRASRGVSGAMGLQDGDRRRKKHRDGECWPRWSILNKVNDRSDGLFLGQPCCIVCPKTLRYRNRWGNFHPEDRRGESVPGGAT